MNGVPKQCNELSLLKEEYIRILACCAAEKPPKKEGVHIYLWSIRLEGIQYMDYVYYYPNTERVTVTHTWMRSPYVRSVAHPEKNPKRKS